MDGKGKKPKRITIIFTFIRHGSSFLFLQQKYAEGGFEEKCSGFNSHF
jgi:hypothetical protein